jgi:hypothetical protein
MLLAGGIQAQPAAVAPKTLNMVRLDTAPTIDGRLDEPVWSQAAIVEDFHQVQPNEFAEPTERTRVFVFYDDDAIYVGAELADSDPDNLTANILRQGQLIQDEDEFVVILDPFNDQRSGYRFETNPNGIRNDAIYENATQTQWDWDGIWRAAASRTAEGWVAEMAIPFKTLSFDPANDTWGINFSRNVARSGERMGWVSRNRNQNASIAGRAVGMNGMQQGMGLDIVPSVTLRETKIYSPSSGESDFEPSLDLFYKITPALNASLTINTDFSAAEVDDRQVNLTRFGLFFPEKRDFFLKDADIFEFGRITSADGAFSAPTLENGRPFFSRSIGLSPLGEPVDLEYGGKVSGRVGRWNIGTLAIRQDEYSGVDATDIFVGRAAMNVLDESSVGMIVTSGDPRSNIHNDVVGVDFRYQNTRLPGGRQIQAETWYQRSDTEGLDGDDAAFGLRVRLPNNTGWRGGIGVKQLDRNFNPALGFIDRRGVRDHTLELGYTLRPQHARLASIFAGVDAQRVDLLDGSLQSQQLKARLIQLETLGSDIIALTYEANKEALFEPFEIFDGIVIPDEGYSFNRYGLRMETGAHRTLSGALEFRGGDFFGGERADVEADFTWKPSRHFQASLGYEVNEINLPQGEFDARIARLGFDVVISATLSWVNLIQYDNLSENVGINSRVHWIPQAGREAFLVLNHNLEDSDRNDSFHSAAADVSIKLNYTFRF